MPTAAYYSRANRSRYIWVFVALWHFMFGRLCFRRGFYSFFRRFKCILQFICLLFIARCVQLVANDLPTAAG